MRDGASFHVSGCSSDVDDIRLPDHVDPARWPFCEARARAAAALAAFPTSGRMRQVERDRRPKRDQVLEAQARRRAQRGAAS